MLGSLSELQAKLILRTSLSEKQLKITDASLAWYGKTADPADIERLRAAREQLAKSIEEGHRRLAALQATISLRLVLPADPNENQAAKLGLLTALSSMLDKSPLQTPTIPSSGIASSSTLFSSASRGSLASPRSTASGSPPAPPSESQGAPAHRPSSPPR